MSKVLFMPEKHNISISERLYNNIKEYCKLNELKLNVFVEELIQKSFNVEKFGDAPFAKQEKPESPPKKEPVIVNEYVKELETIQKEKTEPVVKRVKGPEPIVEPEIIGKKAEKVVEPAKTQEKSKRKIRLN